MRSIQALKAALVATVVAAGAVAGPPAWADRGFAGHGHHAPRAYPSWGLGLGLLAGTALLLTATERRPLYAPPVVYAAPPVYLPPPVMVAPSAVPAYVEPTWWYYCARPAGYYPYVNVCPSGWTRVAPTPPG